MDEFALIRRFFTPDKLADDVILGVGDDGAVLKPPAGRHLVAVVDTLVADVHYPSALDAADVGYRAVAVNLSDIAAMGAAPRWMTLALTLVESDIDWLAAFSEGLSVAAAEHDLALVGGDTTRGDQIVVSVQILGDIEPGHALTRGGARPGDLVCVSGTLGDAAAGLQIFENGNADSPEAQVLIDRFRRPTARVALGRALNGLANAAIDVSDGLLADLRHLLDASGVGAEIDVDRLPLSAALAEEYSVREARRFALSGGDDYELAFTIADDIDLAELAERSGTAVTAIGRIVDGDDLVCLDDGEPVEYGDGGYVHFSEAEDV